MSLLQDEEEEDVLLQQQTDMHDITLRSLAVIKDAVALKISDSILSEDEEDENEKELLLEKPRRTRSTSCQYMQEASLHTDYAAPARNDDGESSSRSFANHSS